MSKEIEPIDHDRTVTFFVIREEMGLLGSCREAVRFTRLKGTTFGDLANEGTLSSDYGFTGFDGWRPRAPEVELKHGSIIEAI